MLAIADSLEIENEPQSQWNDLVLCKIYCSGLGIQKYDNEPMIMKIGEWFLPLNFIRVMKQIETIPVNIEGK